MSRGIVSVAELLFRRLCFPPVTKQPGMTAMPRRSPGLARAFFYAKARALLVSHWYVSSDAAVKLATKTFAELKANPSIGRAEALRRSVVELIKSAGLKAHPAQAAPGRWSRQLNPHRRPSCRTASCVDGTHHPLCNPFEKPGTASQRRDIL